MYILKCHNESYHTGSTTDLDKRLNEHNAALGAEYIKRRLPVKLFCFEEFQQIDQGFKREKNSELD